MSGAPTTVTPLASYRNETPFPFCPGCGHGPILDRLNEALGKLALDPRQIVLVSDIGCSGLSDQYFATSAFHGLHGRSLTYATGIKLARPELNVIVVMGDGGAGIGGAHLLNAARRNIGITLLVFNNLNFGMTGGQHSVTTPAGALTSTTPEGNLERPLDLCATVAANGASYVYRGTSFDRDLAERIAEGIRTPGFALLDVWELCTAYFVPRNRASRKSLGEILSRLGFESGVLLRREQPEFAAAWRQAHPPAAERPAPRRRGLEPRYTSRLDRRFHLMAAGAAGGRVRSTVRLAGIAAILSGLRAAQRDDYPVTVQTGHSVSELILDPEPIEFTGAARPDALLLLSPEGLVKARPALARMGSEGVVFTPPSLSDFETAAHRVVLDPGEELRPLVRTHQTLILLAAAIERLGLFPLEALEEAVRRGPAAHREKGLEAIAAGRLYSSSVGTVGWRRL